MSGSAHGCAAIGCVQVVALGRLMCRRCWALVPRELQREVWANWELYQRGTLRPYAASRLRAIIAVAERRGQSGTEKFERAKQQLARMEG